MEGAAVSTSDQDMSDLKEAIVNLDKKLDRLVTTVDTIKSAQDLFTADMQKIKDPDTGIYPRIRTLEQWKETNSKFIWIIATSTAAILIKQIWDLLTVPH
jgi:hypothetical protein